MAPVVSAYFILLVPFFLSSTTRAFSHSSSSTPSSPSSSSSAPPLIDRVPTYRLYHQGTCQLQLPGRGEVHECRSRLHEAITANIPSSSKAESPSSSQRTVAPILELESPLVLEQHLQQTRDLWTLIAFYGRACKQCALLAPMYDSLPYVYRDLPLVFARADVIHFPALVVPPPDPTVFQNLDRSVEIEERLEGCPRCGGTGFIECHSCEGKGHVIKTVNGFTVADVCMTCVGHKRVPCPQCGGKCYLC